MVALTVALSGLVTTTCPVASTVPTTLLLVAPTALVLLTAAPLTPVAAILFLTHLRVFLVLVAWYAHDINQGVVMQRVNELRLPRVFSDIFINAEGEPEIGFIEDMMQNIVLWSLSDEELVCMTEDARDIIGRSRNLYTSTQKASTARALERLEERLGQREAYRGRKIVWPIFKKGLTPAPHLV